VNAQAVEQLVARGASAATTLSEMAGVADVVLVVVPSDEDVRRVCLSDDGLIKSGRAGLTVVISASVRPETCREIGEVAGEHGVDVLDAALTGGVRGAEDGQINLLVGGDEAVVARVRPALEPWTSGVHHLGPLGAGQVGKTVNNLVHWAEIAIIHEALLFGLRLGVEPTKMRAALLAGPVKGRTLAEIEQMRLTWWKKDIENAQVMAKDIDYPLPLTERVYQLMPGITVARIAQLITDRDPDE